MSLRSTLISLLVLLLGCTTSDPSDFADDELAESGLARSLEVTAPLELLTGQAAELVVRHRDADGALVQGVPVDFALMGAAPGASLWPSRVQTDADGLARTQLRAGASAMTLHVRASAPDTTPLYLEIVVREAVPTALSVDVRYEGEREVAAYTITVVEEASCTEALEEGATGDVTHTLAESELPVAVRIQGGTRAALVAWAHDGTDVPVASGCVEYEAPLTDEVASRRVQLVIPLVDTPLARDGAGDDVTGTLGMPRQATVTP